MPYFHIHECNSPLHSDYTLKVYMQSTSDKKSTQYLAAILTLFFGLLIGWQAHAWRANEQIPQLGDSVDTNSNEVDLGLFWKVWELLESDYIDADNTTESQRVYGAVKGMVEALGDPYTVFMDPEESKSFEQSLNSELEGIGAELTVREGKLIVVAPLKDSPAEEAGLLPGDYIYKVDGDPTTEMTLWEAIMNIRGEPGTDVVLTVVREGEEDTLDLRITRSKIYVPSIETTFSEVNGKTIAQVSLYSFADDTYLEFLDAIREIKLEGADAMILDLRMNGGGFLDVSIQILNEFFEDEVKAVIVKNGDGSQEVMYTQGEGDLADVPLTVLIDEGSASASEIVAGALQDYERALIIGETSFGKGSVQELVNLIDGSSIRITVAKWFTPNDRGINGAGIEPDMLIEMDGVSLNSEEDIQLQAALDYLSNLSD